MIYIIIIALGWLLCSVLTYVLAKRDTLKRFASWTADDKKFELRMSLLGPFALLGYIFDKLLG